MLLTTTSIGPCTCPLYSPKGPHDYNRIFKTTLRSQSSWLTACKVRSNLSPMAPACVRSRNWRLQTVPYDASDELLEPTSELPYIEPCICHLCMKLVAVRDDGVTNKPVYLDVLHVRGCWSQQHYCRILDCQSLPMCHMIAAEPKGIL